MTRQRKQMQRRRRCLHDQSQYMLLSSVYWSIYVLSLPRRPLKPLPEPLELLPVKEPNDPIPDVPDEAEPRP